MLQYEIHFHRFPGVPNDQPDISPIEWHPRSITPFLPFADIIHSMESTFNMVIHPERSTAPLVQDSFASTQVTHLPRHLSVIVKAVFEGKCMYKLMCLRQKSVN
jgi:hypothetical protein